MKKMLCLWLLLLCGCQSQNDTTIEIQKHVFVEKEFQESWMETCQDGRTYLQLVLDGGYVYQTNERYLSLFYQDGGHIELHNYSIRKDQMIISGEFIPEKTILLVHPNIENIASEGVLMHELGHYFDYQYHFSSQKDFKKIYKEEKDVFSDNKTRNQSEYFADLFKEYTAHPSVEFSSNIDLYMQKTCQKILEKE